MNLIRLCCVFKSSTILGILGVHFVFCLEDVPTRHKLDHNQKVSCDCWQNLKESRKSRPQDSIWDFIISTPRSVPFEMSKKRFAVNWSLVVISCNEKLSSCSKYKGLQLLLWLDSWCRADEIFLYSLKAELRGKFEITITKTALKNKPAGVEDPNQRD